MYCGNLESVRESDIIIFETELDLKKMGVNPGIRPKEIAVKSNIKLVIDIINVSKILQRSVIL